LVWLLSQGQYSSWQQWPASLGQEYFVKGSNWTQIAIRGLVLGIQSDGSLWCLRTPFTNQLAILPAQIGTDTNWEQVAVGNPGFMLLKKDGSLWKWGTNYYSFYRTNLQVALSAPPFRIVSETDWTEAFPCGWQVCVRNKDGRVWTYWIQYHDKTNKYSIFERRADLDGREWLSLSQTDGPNSNFFCAGVRSDGTLWVWLYAPRNTPSFSPQEKIQIGKDHHWKTISLNYQELVALERNGTLWKWEPIWEWQRTRRSAFSHPALSTQFAATPVQLGNRSDWIALEPIQPFALAADGSVWFWGDRGYNPLFAPSRKPEKVANIFSGPP
jgi:alpha-tubulin suppressor-like RCC1 family protein